MDERRQARLARIYLHAKMEILRSKYAREILAAPDPSSIKESFFLRELAWVTLSAGMAEYVIRRKFPAITRSFLYWRSAASIAANGRKCLAAATHHFNHAGKLRAIVRSAEIVSDTKFDLLRERIIANPIVTLQHFPYLGPVTSWHLAKNLGFMVPKPDRHLRRIAEAAGHRSVTEFCAAIAVFVGDSVRQVDVVFWRYATMHRDYVTRLFA